MLALGHKIRMHVVCEVEGLLDACIRVVFGLGKVEFKCVYSQRTLIKS